jgi:diacylglycerol O-acyltransferase / wax synthase
MTSKPSVHESRLTAGDAARLHMGGRENPMAIVALLMLDGALRHEVVVSRFEERLLPHRRFRQRVIEPRFGLGMPRWEDDPRFELRGHVHGVDLAGGWDALEAFASDVMRTPFAADRAAWAAFIVRRGSAGATLVVKVHHALADGSALLGLLEELSDEGSTGRAPRATPLPRASRDHAETTLVDRGLRLAGCALGATRLALRRADPATLSRTRLGPRMRVVFSSGIALEPLSAAAHARGTTVTALLLAAVTGALRTHLSESGPVDGMVLHALLPIHVPVDDAGDLGNHFGSIFVPLPVGTFDSERRLHAIAEELRALRSGGAVASGVDLALAAGIVPSVIERLGVSFFSRKATVMVSNIRGPVCPLHLDGVAIRDLIVCAPSPGRIALGITFMSYGGRVRMAVAADASVVGDVRSIVTELERELATLSSFVSQPRA